MRRTSMAAAILLAFCPIVFAQQPAVQPPALPANILGPQLIAWSELQKPQPIPQPVPPSHQQTPQSADSQTQQQSSTQSFTGTIVQDGGKYILKVSESTSYQIDDQSVARNYEGKQVKVAGSLDTKTNLLHVSSIEVIS